MPLTLDRGFLWQAAPESADASWNRIEYNSSLLSLYMYNKIVDFVLALQAHANSDATLFIVGFFVLFVRLNELEAKAFTVSLFLVEFS